MRCGFSVRIISSPFFCSARPSEPVICDEQILRLSPTSAHRAKAQSWGLKVPWAGAYVSGQRDVHEGRLDLAFHADGHKHAAAEDRLGHNAAPGRDRIC